MTDRNLAELRAIADKIFRESACSTSEKIVIDWESFASLSRAIDSALESSSGVLDGKCREKIAALNREHEKEIAVLEVQVDALEEQLKEFQSLPVFSF